MDLVGFAGGPVRPPLADLAPRDREKARTLLDQAGLLAV
jgi:dihydrodipicolinate synthase/N-acetylneuraminate lyase